MAKVTHVEVSLNIEDILATIVDPAIRKKAVRVLAYAKKTAPVDTGQYRASISLAAIPGGGWRVYATADHSVFVEFGTSKMAAFRTLGKALDAAKG